MIIITSKETNEIIDICNVVDYMPNGYPINIEKNVAYPTVIFNEYHIESVSSEVEAVKYCYTEEKGFYINPNWVEPDPTNTYGIPDETYHAIINGITSEVANSGY